MFCFIFNEEKYIYPNDTICYGEKIIITKINKIPIKFYMYFEENLEILIHQNQIDRMSFSEILKWKFHKHGGIIKIVNCEVCIDINDILVLIIF